MKVLFIGGTGNIGAAASKPALARGTEPLHRGQRAALPGVQIIHADPGRCNVDRDANDLVAQILTRWTARDMRAGGLG